MEKITSKSNTIIKDTNRLFTSSKARNENHLFALEGARLCFDVLNSVYEADTLLYTEDIYSRYPDEIDDLAKKSDRVYVITNDVAQKLTQTKYRILFFDIPSLPLCPIPCSYFPEVQEQIWKHSILQIP